jgi:DNA polymerase I
MIDFDLALEKGGFKSKMILQVHDELLIEAPENEADVVAEILRDVMEKTVKLDVPLKVDVQIGDYWG